MVVVVVCVRVGGCGWVGGQAIRFWTPLATAIKRAGAHQTCGRRPQACSRPGPAHPRRSPAIGSKQCKINRGAQKSPAGDKGKTDEGSSTGRRQHMAAVGAAAWRRIRLDRACRPRCAVTPGCRTHQADCLDCFWVQGGVHLYGRGAGDVQSVWWKQAAACRAGLPRQRRRRLPEDHRAPQLSAPQPLLENRRDALPCAAASINPHTNQPPGSFETELSVPCQPLLFQSPPCPSKHTNTTKTEVSVCATASPAP
jgi:hypothetical protein